MPTRREFVREASASLAVGLMTRADRLSPVIRLASFRADVTPPAGATLCASFVRPAVGVTEPLKALGVVLLGDGESIVLCAVDWCEIRNADHVRWRVTLAEAVGTRPDRVAVQSVHQHDAPLADSLAESLLRAAPQPPRCFDIEWGDRVLEVVAEAARRAVATANPVTHVSAGEANVVGVASTRRLFGEDGKVHAVRFSASNDPSLREAPEGLIDPNLKTIGFWHGDTKLAALHYYASHPMSYYGEGMVSADFVGIARDRLADEDGCPHLYFTGCGGDVAPGKYNDGSPRSRAVLADRIATAIRAADANARRHPIGVVRWESVPITLAPRPDRPEAELASILDNPERPPTERINAALRMAYLRHSAQTPILLTCLALGPSIRVLHLPGEPFVAYQLFAQEAAPQAFVAVAGYGDGGPGYIPLERSFDEGGYEPTQSNVRPDSEHRLKAALVRLLHRE